MTPQRRPADQRRDWGAIIMVLFLACSIAAAVYVWWVK